MNYSFYLLSNASKILACLVPDTSCSPKNCFSDKEELVAKAASSVGWGYGVDDCAEAFSGSEIMCKANNFGPGYISNGLLQFSDELVGSSVDGFSHEFCQEENTYETEAVLPVLLGVMAGAALLVGCGVAFAVSSRLRSAVHNRLSGCASSLFGKGGDPERMAFLDVSAVETPNSIYSSIN